MGLDPVAVALAALQAKVGKRSVRLLSDGAASDISEVVATGIDVLDHHILGIGGFPVGRIVELFADEGTGKTSLMYQTIAGMQRENGICFLEETESSLDSSRATTFGCDLNRVMISQPETLEETIEWMVAAVESFPKSKKGDPPFFIGWDSLAGTATKEEIEKGTSQMGAKGKQLGLAMRVLSKKITDKRVVCVIINQTRKKLGLVFGNPTTTPGGDAVKFHATIRIQLMGGKAVKTGDKHTGKVLTVMTHKNKCASPWRKGKIRLDYDVGWNNVWSTINFAKDEKLIDKASKPTLDNYRLALEKLGWGGGFAAAPDKTEGDIEDAGLDLTGIGDDDEEDSDGDSSDDVDVD